MIDVETIRINSVEEYYQIVEKYKSNNLFRGQAVSEWDIVTGVFRGNCVKDKVAEECRKFSLVQTEEVFKENTRITALG